MKTVTVSQSKNGLSALLRQVRSGHRILIVDRNVPVAVLGPVTSDCMPPDSYLADLERKGIVRRPRRAGSPLARLRAMPFPTLRKGASAVAAVLADRNEDTR